MVTLILSLSASLASASIAILYAARSASFLGPLAIQGLSSESIHLDTLSPSRRAHMRYGVASSALSVYLYASAFGIITIIAYLHVSGHLASASTRRSNAIKHFRIVSVRLAIHLGGSLS